MRRFVFIGFFLLAVLPAFSQEMLSVSDSVVLDEIVSYGSLRKYQAGSKIESIGSEDFGITKGNDLEQLLSRSLPIAFKTDAGGLSTIRIRGTSSSHTSVNFGGIDLNSLTLGQSNFSNVPVYLFDNVGVQFGSASSVNGSGSIGGAVHLGLNHTWTDGFRAEARLSHGSFGESLYGTKLFAGNGKFESVTRAYYYYKTNDFTFLNSTYRDFENGIFEKEDVQRNASLEHYGVLQEINYRLEPGEYFFANVWFECDWRQNQQNMQTNLYNPDYMEEYLDENVRVWAGYKNHKNRVKYEVNGGYVIDNAVNNGNTTDTIRTRRWIADILIEHDLSVNTSYKIGNKVTRINPMVYAYESTLDHEDRVDIYASFFQRIFSTLSATLNLRQGFVSNYKVPFTPSLGASWMAFSEENWVLNFTGNISSSYRVPTFNDRFWVLGGNPDLKPEKGMSYELGSRWSYCNTSLSGNIKVNAFKMNIDDWILWKNGGSFWYAENVQNVVSQGLEFMTNWKFKLFSLPVSTGLNYTFTSTQRVQSLNQTNALNRQMEYVPLHSGNFFFNMSRNKLIVGIDGTYMGEQYTDEEDKNVLSPYFLLNFNASYEVKIESKNKVLLGGMIQNMLNTSYQSGWGYAMPGTSYRISLTYQFN